MRSLLLRYDNLHLRNRQIGILLHRCDSLPGRIYSGIQIIQLISFLRSIVTISAERCRIQRSIPWRDVL